MRRGEVWTIAGGADFVGKPRPAIILQSDIFEAAPSVTVCPLTSDMVENFYARFTLAPSASNGLKVTSQAMVDKITTVPKFKVGRQIGRLDAADVARLNQHVILFLGLAE